MNIEKLAKHLKEFTLDEIEMITETYVETELEQLLNSNKILFENGIYKYTYGATNDYQEILRVKKEISDRFFGIFVVAFVEGKRTDLTQAIQASKKK